MTEDINLETIKKTQDSLGKYIKRPPLTEKLLKKPPFRFLHDIITNVINDTGFLKGLYDNNEMQSENIKDRDTKIAFLQKLIDTLKIISDERITARPSKIIAGLEAVKTNQLLQIIGHALEKKIDSTEAVQQITGTPMNSDRKTNAKSKTDGKSKRNDESKKVVSKDKEDKTQVIKKKQSPRIEKESRRKSVTPNEKQTNAKPMRRQVTQEEESSDVKTSKELIGVKSTEPSSTSAGTVWETEKTLTNTETVSHHEPDSKILIPEDNLMVKSEVNNEKPIKQESNGTSRAKENQSQEPEAEVVLASKQNIARLRPPSVRPSSARPAAPRLRDKVDTVVPPEQLVPLGKVHVIVEHAAPDEDNEETVRVEMPVHEEPAVTQDIPAERGHLVQQILTQIGEQQQPPAIVQPSRTTRVDDQRLTHSVQTLTRAANPLGKLVSYVHEDVDSMLSELRSWVAVNRGLREQLTRERARNHDATRPLLQQLQRLDGDIVRHRNMIHSTQASVLRNQHKIKQLLNTN